MDLIQHALCKVAEEASEVTKAALKCQQFGIEEVQVGSTVHNYGRLIAEYQDLLSSMARLNKLLGGSFEPPLVNMQMIVAKDIRVKKYLDLSIQLGRVFPIRDFNDAKPKEDKS